MSKLLSFLVGLFQQKNTKGLLFVLGFIFVGMCFGEAEYTESDLTKNIIEIFDLIFGLLALVLGPMVVLAGWLLSPDWTMGDFFGLRSYFKSVWVLVSNIVYVIFALMLLFMAVMQIFGGAESEYAFKKRLGRFLVGILIVPFTWLIVSWTLSFANQAVAAVLSIPLGSIKIDTGTDGKQSTSLWHKKVLPTEFDFNTKSSGYGDMTCENGTLKENGKVRCMSPAEFLTYNQSGPFFIIMVYAYNIFKIQNADLQNIQQNFCKDSSSDSSQKKETAKNCVTSLVAIVRDFGLSLIVTVFFAVMLVALCWVLLMRAIKLWIYIMLSPLFGLAYFTGKSGETFGEAGEAGFGQVGFKQFFQLAMVPVLVSAVLAFGLLFVGVVRDNFHPAVNTGQKEVCTDKKQGYMVTYCITESDGKYTSTLTIGQGTKNAKGESTDIVLNFGDEFSTIIGTAESAGVLSTTAGAVAGGIQSVEDIFAHIILTMMALVFMFMGVKIAVQYDAVTKAAFEPFAKLGEATGNFIAHSPSYLPLPHPSFASALTPAGISGIAEKIKEFDNNKQAVLARSAGDIFDGQLNSLKSALKEPATTMQNAANQFADAASKINGVHPELIAEALRKSVQNVADSPEKNAFLADIERNERNQRGLQAIVADTDRMAKLLGKAPESDKSHMQRIYDTVGSLNGRVSSTSSATNIRTRFDSSANQYKNGSTTISLNPSSWSSEISPHTDADFRKTIKEAFLSANIDSASDILSTNIASIKTSLKTSTGINFETWNESQLKNLFDDSQKR